MGADGRARLLTDEGQHRLVVELGVVEAVQEVNGPRPGSRDAHADLARELGSGTGHEPGHLLMSDLNEVDRALCAGERADEAADAVAWIAEDAAHAPGLQAVPDEVRDRARIVLSPCRSVAGGAAITG